VRADGPATEVLEAYLGHRVQRTTEPV